MNFNSIRPAILGLSACLSACASNVVKNDFAFGDDPTEALIVIRKLPTAHETRINIRRVSLDAKEFAPEQAKAINLGRGMTPRSQAMLILGGPLLAAAAPGPRNVLDENFFLLKVKAGDYAVVSHVTEETTSGSGARTTRNIVTHCYSLGAPVYQLGAGEISLVNLNGVDRELFAQLLESDVEFSEDGEVKSLDGFEYREPEELLRETLADFPNIKGEVRSAEAIATITFDGEKTYLTGADCPKGRMIKSVDYPKDIDPPEAEDGQ